MRKKDQALIVFIKNAEKGKVKTRLASTLGDDKALQIYKALLKHTRVVSLTADADRLLFYSKHIEADDDWSSKEFHKLVQEGNDLGERMSKSFEYALEQYSKAVIIGSDCISLTQNILEDAFAQLEKYNFVIGPAMDGGYYLLGMQNYSPAVFQNIEWSTKDVLSSTIEKIKDLKQSYFLLPELSDIDFEEDWDKFGFELLAD